MQCAERSCVFGSHALMPPMVPASSSDASDGSPPSESEASSSASPEEDVPPTECANCGRSFTGNYCPECGQPADWKITATGVVGGFAQEFADIERGVWPTLVGLTLRPGAALQEYLQGAQRQLINPGRYLLIATLFSYGATRLLVWIGATEPLAATVDRLGDTGIEGAMRTVLQGLVAYKDIVLHAGYLIVAGLLALLLWRLFRDGLRRGGEALALASFLTGHAILLTTIVEDLGGRLLLFIVTRTPVEGSLLFDVAVMAGYVGICGYQCFGPGWKSAAKAAFAGGWAIVEFLSLVLAGLLGAVAVLLWWTPETYVPASETASVPGVLGFGMLALLCAAPLLLHAAGELYVRFAR